MRKLHFIGGGTAEITVIKEGRKWIYFTVGNRLTKYRADKQTGEVQVGPYWDTVKGMYVD